MTYASLPSLLMRLLCLHLHLRELEFDWKDIRIMPGYPFAIAMPASERDSPFALLLLALLPFALLFFFLSDEGTFTYTTLHYIKF